MIIRATTARVIAGTRTSAVRRTSSLAMLSVALISMLLSFQVSGCKKHSHTADARLQKIDEMLNTHLPPGTPRPRVQIFLNSRGYQLQNAPDKTTIVAVVRLVDTETLQPATARVTFRFDSQNKLLSYEMQSAPDAPLRP